MLKYVCISHAWQRRYIIQGVPPDMQKLMLFMKSVTLNYLRTALKPKMALTIVRDICQEPKYAILWYIFSQIMLHREKK